jgi:hypothetical protein
VSPRSLHALLLPLLLVVGLMAPAGASPTPVPAAAAVQLPDWPTAECATATWEITGSFVRNWENTNFADVTITGSVSAGCAAPVDSVWAITQMHRRSDGYQESVMGTPWVSRVQDTTFSRTGRILMPNVLCLGHGLQQADGKVYSVHDQCAFLNTRPDSETEFGVGYTDNPLRGSELSRWPDLTTFSPAHCTDCLYLGPLGVPAAPDPGPLPGAPPRDVPVWPYARGCVQGAITKASLPRTANTAGRWSDLSVTATAGTCRSSPGRGATAAVTVYYDGGTQHSGLVHDYGAMSLPFTVTGRRKATIRAKGRNPGGVTAVCLSDGLNRRRDGLYANHISCVTPADAEARDARPRRISTGDPRVRQRLDYWPSPGIDRATYCARCVSVLNAPRARPAVAVSEQLWPARTPPRAFNTTMDWVHPRQCAIASITDLTSTIVEDGLSDEDSPVRAAIVSVAASVRPCPGSTLSPRTGYAFSVHYDDSSGMGSASYPPPTAPAPTRTGYVSTDIRAICLTSGLDRVRYLTVYAYHEACVAIRYDAAHRVSFRPIPVDSEQVTGIIQHYPRMIGWSPIRPCANCL